MIRRAEFLAYPLATYEMNDRCLHVQAQTLQEASKQEKEQPSDFKLSKEQDALKKEIDDDNGNDHEHVKTEGTSADEAMDTPNEREAELDTLDFSPDSFWNVLPDLAPLIASSSGRKPDVRSQTPHTFKISNLLDFECAA